MKLTTKYKIQTIIIFIISCVSVGLGIYLAYGTG